MKTTRAWIALIAAAATMSACGQPEFHYVRDRDGTTYFKVPSSFSRLDASPLERLLSDDHPSSAAAQLRRQQVWSTAYDQAARPAVEHLFGSRDPFVYVTVRKLTDGQRNEISLNRMRDFLLPVTEQTRTAYLMSVLRAGRAPAFSHFEPLMDRELTLGDGARGGPGPLQLPDRRRDPDVRPDGHPRRPGNEPVGDVPRVRGDLLHPARRRVRPDRGFLQPAQAARMREHPVKTTPHAGLRAPGSGPADPDAATAERRRLWDRSRFLVSLTAVYLVLALKVMADHPGIVPFADAVRVVARDHQWIFWLLGAEAARQLHLLAAERLPGYRRFWRRRVFGGWERWSHRRLDDWTRFRVARLAKIAVWVALLALVLAAVLGTSPAVALFEAPALLSRALPLVVQIAVPLVVIIVVFAGLLWFLSRSGVETYFPGDVTTRFADVWGQDHVVERIRQSLVLLERPGEIERRGGYVPGGLLLWGGRRAPARR
ncbi:hypothetical protein ACFSTC_16720 [Nonomuraea ferruginea]